MDLTLIRFGVGNHDATDTPTGDRDLCIMEAVAFVAGEPWGDKPACASPVVSAFLREWNDTLSDEDRDRLLPAAVWVPRLVDSLADNATEERRAYLALDWMIRVQTPAWLDLTPSLAGHAAALRALPEVVDLTTAQAAGDTLHAAGAAAWASARASARAAARASAGDAAWGAAWAAARPALLDAALGVTAADPAQTAALAALAPTAEGVTPTAGAALRPIIETLQQSALDLLDRMLVVGAHPDRRKEE